MTPLKHLARWLAWQLRDIDVPASQLPARITIFSTADPERGGPRGA